MSTIENNSLLIVKSLAQNLLPVETFLRNRGWTLHSTTDLKEAISVMIKHQPNFVMISVDHPNKRVLKLSKVLVQAFPCCLISFAEVASASSYKTLTESSTEYLIYPPVTGPAIERTVNKYHKDQAAGGLHAVGEKNYSSNYQAPDGVVNIKGKGVATLQSIMAQVMGDESSKEAVETEQRVDLYKSLEQYSDYQMPGKYSQAPSEDSAAGFISSAESFNSSDEYSPSQPIIKKMEGYRPEYESSPSGENFQKRTQYHDFDVDSARTRLGITDLNVIPTRFFKDSIILKGSRDALDKSVRKPENPGLTKKLSAHHEVYCILINSEKFSGYLLTAIDPSTPLKESFITLVRERLFSFLQDNGEKMADQQNMPLELHQVPFEDWAIEQAEFLYKRNHDRNEIVMAFFPHDDVLAPIFSSASEEMCAVDISLLEPDKPVRCNLYLYLPSNQKYILYTPQGGKLYLNQLQKLLREGVQQVHILRDDVQDFHAYRAQNYLNGKIGEFKKSFAEAMMVS